MKKITVAVMLVTAMFFVISPSVFSQAHAPQYIYMLGDSITALTDFQHYIATPVKNRGICGVTSSVVTPWLPYISKKDADKVFILTPARKL